MLVQPSKICNSEGDISETTEFVIPDSVDRTANCMCDTSPERVVTAEEVDDERGQSLMLQCVDHVTEFEVGDEHVAKAMTAKKGDGGLEPYEGMQFQSDEQAYKFYNEYAWRVGFNTCVKTSWRSRTDRSLLGVEFGCSKHGFKRTSENTKKPRPNLKTNCQAAVKLKRADIGKWIAIRVNNEHNHLLTPASVHLIQEHRVTVHKLNLMGDAEEEPSKLQKDKEARQKRKLEKRIKYNNLQRGLVGETNGQVGDGSYVLKQAERESLGTEDAQIATEHFKHMQNMNPTFFHAMDVDQKARPRCIFWVDGKCRMDYTRFGDVIAFETTYLINKYKLPFVSFVGINHHGQSVLFGCALIGEESVEVYAWLFKTWLGAMYGRAPIGILSDHGKAIKSAVSQVFPGTQHRFCVWHVLQKVPKRLSHLCKGNKKFMVDLKDCIYKSFGVAEFEQKWQKLIEVYDLEGMDWLSDLYDDRHRWASPYVNDTLFAGMCSFTHSESRTSFFDSCMIKETTLKGFFNQYLQVLQSRYDKELQSDYETTKEIPQLKTTSPFEAQMARIYTTDIFKKFQVEITGIPGCFTLNFQQVWDTVTYSVRDLHAKLDYKVTWTQSGATTSCLCRTWELQGYLCRHVMLVLLMSGVHEIPSHYILKRWTMEGRNRVQVDRAFLEPKLQHCNDLYQRFFKLAEEGSIHEEGYDRIISALEAVMSKIV